MSTGNGGPRSPLPSRRHLYRLEFFADRHGDGQIVELLSRDLTDALELIEKDRSQRVVDIWEDGTLVCRVTHGPKGLNVANKPPPGNPSVHFG